MDGKILRLSWTDQVIRLDGLLISHLSHFSQSIYFAGTCQDIIWMDRPVDRKRGQMANKHSITCGQKLGHVLCFAGSLHYIYHIYQEISHISIRIFTEDEDDEGHLESIRVLCDWLQLVPRAQLGRFP